jgi:DNA-binding beta-propeller fold protein YncE
MSKFFRQFFPARAIWTRHSAQRPLTICATVGISTGIAIAIAGCGSNLRPTVTPILGTGPASQPQSFAFAISSPSATTQGVGTVIDYSGDTVMATAAIGPGPVTFALNAGGTTAWTLNVDGTVSNIPVSTNLQTKLVTYSTLNPLPASGVDPVVALFGGALGLYALDVSANNVDVLTGSPDAFKLVVPLAPDTTPVTMVGVAGATRYYAITQGIPYGATCNTNPTTGTAGVTGMADAIETSTYSTPSARIPLGLCPVYAVGSPDTKRVFVLNRGSDTITVINSQNNTLNQCAPGVNQDGQPYTCHPSLPLSTTAVTNTGITPPNGTSGMPAVAGPVYAEYNPATDQLVVSNYDGSTVNIIDVSLDEFGNDSATFGTTFTVPVGKNPAAVTVLADGSRAYTANQSDDAVGGAGNGTVTIINLSTHTVEKTLPVTGHPRTVVSTQNSLFGKVYAVAPDSPYISIIRTDEDILSTTVLTQGNAIDVRITSTDGNSGDNVNLVSRLPGAGQPCYLPPSAFVTAGVTINSTNCLYQNASQLVP